MLKALWTAEGRRWEQETRALIDRIGVGRLAAALQEFCIVFSDA